MHLFAFAAPPDRGINGEHAESWGIATREWTMLYRIDTEDNLVLPCKEAPIKFIEKVRMDTPVGSEFVEAKSGDLKDLAPESQQKL